MTLMRDLSDPRMMYLKAVLFIVIGMMSSALLIANSPSVQTVVLLALSIWSFCRLYYFAFYVITHYIDPTYRFAGLTSIIGYIYTRWHKQEVKPTPDQHE